MRPSNYDSPQSGSPAVYTLGVRDESPERKNVSIRSVEVAFLPQPGGTCPSTTSVGARPPASTPLLFQVAGGLRNTILRSY